MARRLRGPSHKGYRLTMCVFLARSISTAKWKARSNIAEDEIPADAVTYDMRTADNMLSFWLYDPGREGSLDDIALALASARDNVQRLDLVWLDQEQVEQIKLKIDSTLGETPAKHLRDNHRDVVGIDLVRLVDLARTIANALTNNQTKRFTERQIQALLSKAAKDNLIATSDLKRSVAEKLQ
jgi:hypothetical protein